MSYIRIFTFDWDDNIIQMPTKICVLHKENQTEQELTTEEFATAKNEIGISGKYEEYEIIGDAKSPFYSFRYFRDKKGENVFLKDLQEELGKRRTRYKRSWKNLQKALSEKITARHVAIITARGHKPTMIYEALKHLQAEGLIKHLPLLRNIYPVSLIKEATETIAETKSRILVKILDKACQELVNNNYDSYHKFSFSDDDVDNILNIHKTLGDELFKGKYREFILQLHYTGIDDRLKPGTYVIGRAGQLLFQKEFLE